MSGKHEKRKENRHRERIEDLAVATGAGLLVELILRLIDWMIKQ